MAIDATGLRAQERRLEVKEDGAKSARSLRGALGEAAAADDAEEKEDGDVVMRKQPISDDNDVRNVEHERLMPEIDQSPGPAE